MEKTEKIKALREEIRQSKVYINQCSLCGEPEEQEKICRLCGGKVAQYETQESFDNRPKYVIDGTLVESDVLRSVPESEGVQFLVDEGTDSALSCCVDFTDKDKEALNKAKYAYITIRTCNNGEEVSSGFLVYVDRIDEKDAFGSDLTGVIKAAKILKARYLIISSF